MATGNNQQEEQGLEGMRLRGKLLWLQERVRQLEDQNTQLKSRLKVAQMGMPIVGVKPDHKFGTSKDNFDTLVKVASKVVGYSVETITGRSRKSEHVAIRAIIAVIWKETTGDSWKHIGSLMQRDHSTLLNANANIRDGYYRGYTGFSAALSQITLIWGDYIETGNLPKRYPKVVLSCESPVDDEYAYA